MWADDNRNDDETVSKWHFDVCEFGHGFGYGTKNDSDQNGVIVNRNGIKEVFFVPFRTFSWKSIHALPVILVFWIAEGNNVAWATTVAVFCALYQKTKSIGDGLESGS